MKNCIYIALLISALTFIDAQEKRSLNIFAGYQQLSTKNLETYSDFSSGSYFGVSKNIGLLFLNTPINFGFQFSQRGGKQPIDLNDFLIEGNSENDDTIQALNLLLSHSYFDFFVNANFSIGNISFYAGPMVGINLSSEVQGLDGIVLPAIYNLSEEQFEPEKFDWGINCGLTFHINRFLGLSIEAYQGGPSSGDKQFRNYGLKLSLGL
tara:strand:- start:585 stop:1211 length:627 start_codon:yes stop_codon:yes gene_type:complete